MMRDTVIIWFYQTIEAFSVCKHFTYYKELTQII